MSDYIHTVIISNTCPDHRGFVSNTFYILQYLALKDVLILVLFLNLASGYENMNDHFF